MGFGFMVRCRFVERATRKPLVASMLSTVASTRLPIGKVLATSLTNSSEISDTWSRAGLLFSLAPSSRTKAP